MKTYDKETEEGWTKGIEEGEGVGKDAGKDKKDGGGKERETKIYNKLHKGRKGGWWARRKDGRRKRGEKNGEEDKRNRNMGTKVRCG